MKPKTDHLIILKKLFYERIINRTELAKSMTYRKGSIRVLGYKINKLREIGFDIRFKRVGKKVFYYLV